MDRRTYLNGLKGSVVTAGMSLVGGCSARPVENLFSGRNENANETANATEPTESADDWELTLDENFDTGELNDDIWQIGAGEGVRQRDSKTAWEFTREEDVWIDTENDHLVLQLDHHEAVSNGLESPFTERGQTERPPYGWYSGSVTTRNNFRQRHGYFAARIRFPEISAGVNPAFWSLPNPENDIHWPPEIDFFEQFSEPNKTYHTVHWATDADDPSGTRDFERYAHQWENSVLGEWHTFAACWYEGGVDFYIDEEYVTSITAGAGTEERFIGYGAPFNINLTSHIRYDDLYGNPYQHDDWPYTWEVDWVRVWKGC